MYHTNDYFADFSELCTFILSLREARALQVICLIYKQSTPHKCTCIMAILLTSEGVYRSKEMRSRPVGGLIASRLGCEFEKFQEQPVVKIKKRPTKDLCKSR